jgi:hypothetical protein
MRPVYLLVAAPVIALANKDAVALIIMLVVGAILLVCVGWQYYRLAMITDELREFLIASGVKNFSNYSIFVFLVYLMTIFLTDIIPTIIAWSFYGAWIAATEYLQYVQRRQLQAILKRST